MKIIELNDGYKNVYVNADRIIYYNEFSDGGHFQYTTIYFDKEFRMKVKQTASEITKMINC